MRPDHGRVLNAIRSEQWLITDEWYDRIVEIASRENTLTPEMISAFESKKSGREYMVTMFGDTAVLDVQGPVFRYANLFTMFSGATSTETVSSELARLERDDKVSRVIMRYDTPGGVASGAAETSSQIQNFSKPLVSFATGMCASLGYFWASQGDQLIVAEDAIVGNIGTRTKAPGPTSEDDMVSKNAPRKILDRGAIEDVINSLEDVFISHVATGRGVSSEHVEAHFGQGGVFVGQNAVTAGLADTVGTLDSILGGDFPIKPSAQSRVILKSPLQDKPMGNGESDGGVTAAEHKAAVDTARNEGHEAGRAEANANAKTDKDNAVKAENDRCVAIFEASAGKPTASVAPIMKNTAITAEQAVEIVAGFPDQTNSGGSHQYSDNPDITNDVDTSSADDDADIEASWGKAIKEAV